MYEGLEKGGALHETGVGIGDGEDGVEDGGEVEAVDWRGIR